MVSDMRPINKVIFQDYVQAKPINHLFDEILSTGARVFATFYVKSAFFSISYTKGTNFPTTFYADCSNNLNSLTGESDTGRYVYDRLIMGAQSSFAALERAIEYTLQWLPNCRVYCDDVIVFTKDCNFHLDILKRMFQACAKHGLKFEPATVKALFTTIN